MSIVRITDAVMLEVKNNIRNLFESRIAKCEDELINSDVGQECWVKNTTQMYRELAVRLNSDPNGDWVGRSTSCNVKLKYENADGGVEVCMFDAKIDPPLPFPLKLSRYGITYVIDSEYECYPALVEIALRRDAIVRERDKLIVDLVDGVMDKCPTLQRVVKVWPTVLEFVSNKTRERYLKKTDKQDRKNAADPVIDASVKASLIAARMMKGNGDGERNVSN